MATYIYDDNLLIHYFQDNLTGSAIRLYNKLDRSHVYSWKNLACAFIAQYKHVANMALYNSTLQSMEKNDIEGFKDLARRWRDITSQVHPPLTKKEIIVMFVNSLKAPYYERLIENATKTFADMVLSGEIIATMVLSREIIEATIKSGKIEEGNTINSRKELVSRKKEAKS
ncbi:uncharacterized protein LOC110417947 [Herrania umbratica]|uniref:Uncharacterized protein LOC110417947 n=1 Tax=Herrania umbratica TaxID=108875 RepID=A0A6J1AG87_9ROSI|nr:uncharacterized protein LOC110417947 [Herrania umbratica]